MIIKVLKINADGTQQEIDKEVPDNLYDVVEVVPPPTLEERVSAAESALLALLEVQNV